MPPWSLITPASRGIGLALARHVMQSSNIPVVATVRNNPERTKELILEGLSEVDEKRLTVLRLDVLDESSISTAASACASLFPPSHSRLHLSFIIPGILFPEKSITQVDASNALLSFQTNTIGPLLVLKHFAQFLPSKRSIEAFPREEQQGTDQADLMRNLPLRATVALMSARVGSISDNRLGGWYSYRASKAALNQVVKTFDNHLRTVAAEKAVAIGLHPGTVKTDLSKEFWGNVKEDKLFRAEWVAEQLLDVVNNLKESERGRCWDYNGKEIAA